MGSGHDTPAGLRALPSVERLAAGLDAPHAQAVAVAREVIAERREELRRCGPGAAPDAELLHLARARVEARAGAPAGPRRVINATGVIVHTNLGRAPLAEEARAAVMRIAEGYSDLELDLAGGARGSRHDHLERELCELTGAEAAFAVNNGAGAALLCAAGLGGPGRDIVVSRGQLVEIGGGFRVPDVVAQSGSELVEVGTTNRTRVADYERALGPRTGAIMRVHPSNFRTVGFVETVGIAALCSLAVPVIDDVGSGSLDGSDPLIADEPGVRDSVAAGSALVCFSGDKLLGGPQAGVIVGRADAVAAARSHPLARALRIGSLPLAALAATVRLHRDPERAQQEVPVLAMLHASETMLTARAERMAAAVGARAALARAAAKVGGGALPLLELEGPVVALDPGEPGADDLARKLRAHDPPVLGRIREGKVLLDPRTLTDAEADVVAAAATRALAG
ncbi:MAG: L-seryl-tRNA(Sec) selenium transferase [Solirubrobacteraceae bacterium]